MTASSMVGIEALRAIVNNPRMSPEMVAKEIDANNQYVRNTLPLLLELGLLQRPTTRRGPVRGIYEATEFGRLVNQYIIQPPHIKTEFAKQAYELLIKLSQSMGRTQQ